MPGCDGPRTAKRSCPESEAGGGDERNYPASKFRGCREELPHSPKPKARDGGWEDQPHTVAARAQEGLGELSHVEGQEGQQ